MWIAILIAPSLYCSAQDIWFNKETGLVEATTDKAIDLSKIVSDYNEMKKSVKQKDSIIIAKNKTIEQLSALSRKQTERVLQLTNTIVEQNTRVEDVSDQQVKKAMGAFSKFSLSGEILTQPQELNNIEGRALLKFKLDKIYLLGVFSIGNDFNKTQVGVGYTFF